MWLWTQVTLLFNNPYTWTRKDVLYILLKTPIQICKYRREKKLYRNSQWRWNWLEPPKKWGRHTFWYSFLRQCRKLSIIFWLFVFQSLYILKYFQIYEREKKGGGQTVTSWLDKSTFPQGQSTTQSPEVKAKKCSCNMPVPFKISWCLVISVNLQMLIIS